MHKARLADVVGAWLERLAWMILIHLVMKNLGFSIMNLSLAVYGVAMPLYRK